MDRKNWPDKVQISICNLIFYETDGFIFHFCRMDDPRAIMGSYQHTLIIREKKNTSFFNNKVICAER